MTPGGDPTKATDKALDLSEFRIRFKVRQADPAAARLKTAQIRVSNLNSDTSQKLIKEYNGVVLQAGYQTGKFGVIFQGTIRQYRRGHETMTESYLDIDAADGDVARNFGVVNTTLSAGSTVDDYVKAVLDKWKELGVQEGYNGLSAAIAQGTPGGSGQINQQALAAAAKSPRGDVLSGMAWKTLDDAVSAVGATWIITDGKVNIVPLTGYLPGEAVKLSGATGLIGWPEQTQQGIYARCLLNPAIRCMGLVQIDEKSINTTLAPGGTGTATIFPTETSFNLLQPVTDDGFYRVVVIDHEGDTRGPPWYTSLVLLAADISSKTVNDNSAVPDSLKGIAKNDQPLPPGSLGSVTPF